MIKDIVAQVRAKLSDEEQSKVSDLLSQITREESNILGDLSNANHESKTRKDKIRELQSKLEDDSDSKDDYEGKLGKLKDQIEELKGFKTQLDDFKSNELKESTNAFNKIITSLTVEETDPKYETYQKVLGKLVLAEDDKELTAEQIKANLTIYEYAKEFGGLEITEENFEDGKNQKGSRPEVKDDPLDAFGK